MDVSYTRWAAGRAIASASLDPDSRFGPVPASSAGIASELLSVTVFIRGLKMAKLAFSLASDLHSSQAARDSEQQCPDFTRRSAMLAC
jgi:hypothetical protein